MHEGSQRRLSLFGGARVALVMTLALALAGFVQTLTPRASKAATAGVEVLMIGDSVLDGLAQGYSTASRQALAARHSLILDAAGCRRLITTSCRIPPAAAPTNALTVLRARAGQFDRVLVVAAGYNDEATGPAGIDAAVDAIIGEARLQGIGHVVWLTYREAGTVGNIRRYQQSNGVLRSRTDPELVIADWAARSAPLPAGWFSSDGIHLGPQAAAAMADLIGESLDQLLPSRCMPGEWTGTPLADLPTTARTAVSGGLSLLPVPVRVVDTRALPGKLGAGRMLTVPIAGTIGVPLSAVAGLVSVTAVEPCADTFLTVFPCGGSPPLASMLNAVAASTVANSGVVRLGDGSLCIYTSQPTDVLVDVSGWIGPMGWRTSPVAPIRLIDTRQGQLQTLSAAQHRLDGGAVLTVDVASLPGTAGASGATINVTAAAPQGSGFLSVLPGPCSTLSLPPSTSNLNVSAGRDAAAAVTVGLGSGELCVFSSIATDVIVDLQALIGTAGGATTAIDPTRMLDSRNATRIRAGQSSVVDLGGPTEAGIVNLTAVDPAGSGYLTLYPCGSVVPTVSNLNVVAGAVVANRAVVSTAGTSRLCLFSSVDTDVVIDVEGYVGAS